MVLRYRKLSERLGVKSMSDNGKNLKPSDFGELLESTLRNVIVQLETIDTRLTMVEDYIKEDIKNKAAAGSIIRNFKNER